MRDLLKELYFGNYSASACTESPNTAYGRALRKVCDLEDRMNDILTPEQAKQFREFADASVELQAEACRHDFMEGYRLGVRLIIEAVAERPNE